MTTPLRALLLRACVCVLQEDSRWLCSHDLMDYSLILGVHRRPDGQSPLIFIAIIDLLQVRLNRPPDHSAARPPVGRVPLCLSAPSACARACVRVHAWVA